MIEEILLGLTIGLIIILFFVDIVLIIILIYKRLGERQLNRLRKINDLRCQLKKAISELRDEKEKLLEDISEIKQVDSTPKNNSELNEEEPNDEFIGFRRLFSKLYGGVAT